MRASKFSAWIILVSLLFATVGDAQTTAPAKSSVAKKTTIQQQSIASLNAQAQKYYQRLTDPDYPLDADARGPILSKWVDDTCQVKRLKYQQDGVDAETAAAIYQNCMKRMSADPFAALAAAAPKPPNPGTVTGSQPSRMTSSAVVPPSDGSCWVHVDPSNATGSNTQYFYQVQCDSGTTPNKMAIVTPVVTNLNGFALEEGIASQTSSKGTNNTTVIFTFAPGANSRRLSLTVPTASIEEKSATYYIASGGVPDPAVCIAASTTTGCFVGEIMVPVPKAPATPVAKCPNESVNMGLASATLDPIETTSTSVAGKVQGVTTGQIQVCVAGKPLGDPVPVTVDNSNSTFTVNVPKGTTLTNGQTVVAQYISPSTNGGSNTYGPALDANSVLVGSCKLDALKSGVVPILSVSQPDGQGMVTLKGKATSDASGKAVSVAKGTTVRICVNDVPDESAKSLPIGTDGTFDGGTITLKVQANAQIVAQTVIPSTLSTPGAPPTYGPLSPIVSVSSNLVVGSVQQSGKPFTILIGGVEYAGYSSQAQTTDAFVNIFYRGPETKSGWSGWGRVRLTSTPSATTNGIGTYIANPTGLTSYSYQNVGQALDYVFGPSWKIPGSKHMYIIGGFGATTPLSSQDAPVTFVAPPPGTLECSTLVNRFSVKNGYNPGLSLNTAPSASTCLAGGYTDIAFTNQDRSNFLLKYGAGVRATYPLFGPNAWSSVDVTLGQDASVSGGYLHGVVFKVDAILPIPTGSASSWLYLFGSTYIRLQSNQNLSPLVLQTPPTPISVPSPTVFVLPLRQPNRDYFRLGVGLNINQLWCKAFGSNCGSSSPDTTTTSGSSAADTTTPAKPGTTPGTGTSPPASPPPAAAAKKS